MKYFTQDYIDFFNELSKNNHKEWFDENRKRYETSVKKPFNVFIGEMINLISAEDPMVQIEPKHAIFRINRDIRFSKDKTPYKTNMSAIISPGGKKDKVYPGVYLEFNLNEIRFYGGAFMLDKNQLLNVREHISENLKTFNKLVNDKKFIKKFETIRGEQHKRIPTEFRDVHAKQPLIANKQFYYFAKIDKKKALSPKLPDLLMEYYHTANPMMTFLREGLGMA